MIQHQGPFWAHRGTGVAGRGGVCAFMELSGSSKEAQVSLLVTAGMGRSLTACRVRERLSEEGGKGSPGKPGLEREGDPYMAYEGHRCLRCSAARLQGIGQLRSFRAAGCGHD